MDATGLLDELRKSKGYRGQIVHVETVPARKAKYGDISPQLPEELSAALAKSGVDRFYTHQVEALLHVRAGRNIVAVTGTASGKSLCYNLPVFESIIEDSNTKALYVYPTKALAQDQLSKVQKLKLDGLKAATYDGDTPKKERSAIRYAANMVFTNPDMLHVGILPSHPAWASFFRKLKYVVIDEVHMYRGVFGSHVANIIRRLKRICAHYGASPRFLCASATVGDPGLLVRDLTGENAWVIDDDGSPSGEKIFAFWQPPFLATKGERRSSNVEAVELFTFLVKRHIRNIVFTKARKTAEIILRHAREYFATEDPKLAQKITAYRAGYRAAERRDIERRLFSGELLGVTSTTALEVGIDIGGLDAVIMTGYPGTIASTWQQAGRSGRGTEQSLAVLVALDNAMDQYVVRNQDYFFSREHEKSIVDSGNTYILGDHLLCAAHELPLDNDEIEEVFGAKCWETLGMLAEAGEIGFDGKWRWMKTGQPAPFVNIRSASSVQFKIISVEGGGALLGTVDGSNAFGTIYPGAIYLHGGQSYVVERLDLDENVAYVEKTEVEYYTMPNSRTHIEVTCEQDSRELAEYVLHFSTVKVTDQVTHFTRKKLFTEEILEKVMLELPEVELETESCWLELSDKLKMEVARGGYDVLGTIHAIEHACIALLPLFALCDRNDIGGVSHPEHPDASYRAAVFIYDGYPGGVGLVRAAYDMFEKLLAATYDAIANCQCEDGCPSCIQSPKCGNDNHPLDKGGAIFALERMLGRD